MMFEGEVVLVEERVIEDGICSCWLLMLVVGDGWNVSLMIGGIDKFI